MQVQSRLSDRIERGKAISGVLGLGYVGLPLILTICEKGGSALGFDIDPAKIDALNNGESYLRHIPSERVAAVRQADRFEATLDFERIAECDVLLICVPTPLTRHREPDMSFVVSTMEAIAPHLRADQLLVLESTTYPGTSAELLQPVLEARGFTVGEDFFLAYSPEREDPGNPDFDTGRIPKVIGASDSVSRALAIAFYDRIVSEVTPVSSLATAEAVKLTENIFRSVNIALVNELKVVFDKMDIDIWEVIDAAKTKPFGFMPFYPGPGLGGHCIPIDPFYLTWKARQYEISTRFIELAGEVNVSMPSYVVDRLTVALDGLTQRGLNGARILVVGLGYKKNLDDTRESPALKIMKLLEDRQAAVSFYDPYINQMGKTREYPQFAGRLCVAFDRAALGAFEAAVICTDHDDVDYQLLGDVLPLIVDTRNAMERCSENIRAMVVKA